MITTIAELPFASKAPGALLGVSLGRGEGVDTSFTGTGWGRVSPLALEAPGAPAVRLRDALVLALHGGDDDPGEAPRPAARGPWDLEFQLPGETLLVPVERFLAVHLPRLPPAADVVLALCNPLHRPLARPPALAPGARLWYALGNVDSFAEPDPLGRPLYGLAATQWIAT